ncbi:cobyrinate a,c-diamide synthase [Youxingia wuxianensis]|uniref:Cobyrinate a,c-diamide synthase n=1 Tax=Youxingia wuxianensis TaxID=2763678 RepID=A0A926EMH7_9FIRM|nr:cobyrinate a,c-diamide synthase [Youxingia wuxianensis]MBC8585080.1 cobyrinate a,c-diamide synthase [Youxingia wuxianensis]
MPKFNLPRIMLAAPASGCGKTTVTCALLQWMIRRGMSVSAFKCGPDYIDPMFHSQIIGAQCRNLDLFFTGEDTVRYLFQRNCAGNEIAVIEGVMGYYDGIGVSTQASSYALAKALQTPVILVINARGMALSAAAQIKGYVEFRGDSQIKGVIINNISQTVFSELKEQITKETGIEVLGYVPKMADCALQSRHLGLVTAQEVKDLKEKLDCLADQLEKTVDIPRLLEIARTAQEISYSEPFAPQTIEEPPVNIGVAKDRAFCFYYEDNLQLLRDLGARIITFSPLEDPKIPQDLDGLLLGGGYPELYACQLSENQGMLSSIKSAIESGMPTIAECGGFMYLHRCLQTSDGAVYPMADVIKENSYPKEKLGRFGYITLTAQKDNLLCNKGEQLAAHEFHYWDSTDPGHSFTAQKPQREICWDCAYTTDYFYGGYPHLYFYSNPDTARCFLKKAREYQLKNREMRKQNG